MRKPRLTVNQARWLAEIDQDIRRYGRDYQTVVQMFSDRFDSGLTLGEIRPLVRQGLLRIVPIGERCRYYEWGAGSGCHSGIGLLGCCKTVDITEKAISLFWPSIAARPYPA